MSVRGNGKRESDRSFTASPRRFLPPFVDLPVVSSIHFLPRRGVLLRRCGGLIRRREVLPCRRRVLPHRRGLSSTEHRGWVRRRLHSLWLGWLGIRAAVVTICRGWGWSAKTSHDVCHGSYFVTH